jgi:SDR family mycofactocin-dependent oxidoreductase
MSEFDGQVILITGGARGQGRAHALTLAQAGADIALCDIAAPIPTIPYPLASQEDLQETKRLVEQFGRRCLTLKADISQSDQVQNMVEQTLETFGRIDALIANAGVFSGGVPGWKLSEEQWDVSQSVNLKGQWLCCKYVIPSMLSQGAGAILLISSLAGLEGYQNCAHYVAAKHGVIGLMRALANELAEFNIRVNALCPSTVNTASIHNPFVYDLFAGGADGSLQHLQAGMRDIHLLPVELLEPEEIAKTSRWLLSKSARHITGIALPIDAGAQVKFGK